MASRRKQEKMSTFYAEVVVTIQNTEIRCIGLIDTGNQLTDPLSRMPVMVMEASLWREYLPDSVGTAWSTEHADNLIMEWTEDESFGWRDRLRLVPYRGINRGTQFMIALKPDEVSVTVDGHEVRTTRVLVGLDGGTLSSDNAYRAIIHPLLAEGSNEKPMPLADVVTALSDT
ncbi:Sporulation factor SpoIIGA [compost metagenome]